MTMRPELLRGFYADSTMPMARKRTRRVLLRWPTTGEWEWIGATLALVTCVIAGLVWGYW